MNFATFFILFLNVESFVFMTKPVKTRVLTLMDNCKNETYIKPSILLLMEVKDLYVNDWMEGEVVWDIDVGVDVDGNDKKEENTDYIINDMFIPVTDLNPYPFGVLYSNL